MVLTPQEVEEQAKPNEQELKRLEEKIDELLVSDRKTGRPYTTIGSGYFPNRASADAITKLYESHGWSVEYVSDQRDGDFYQFSKKKEKQMERQEKERDYSASPFPWRD